MRKIIFSFAAVVMVIGSAFAAKVNVEYPTAKQPTSFAIVIDSKTLSNCRPEVNAYRAALQRDGLSVYTISAEWETPDQVREQLQKLYKKNSRKMPLEGVVFIGDVPYASILNAQHMTTAFKMNEERFPIEETAVTSDRFYDDLNLEFDYIKRDSLNSLRHYYSLKEESAQHLNPSFYSGRIIYPEQMGGDKYKAIKGYLRKVVAERRRNEKLDYVVTYAGAAYNSDCLVTWMDERIAMDEMFPQLNRNDFAALTQLNFRMKSAKHQLYDQIERKEVDLMIFNEHGSPDKQHLDGADQIESFDPRAKALQEEVFYYMRREQRKEDGDVEGAKAFFKEKYQLTDKFFEPFFNPEKKEQTENLDDLNLEEIAELRPMPRFVIFNACYNGSFHQSGYVAGSYIFGSGRTIVAQGNTVNVLQDRWTYEMLGLLSNGVRVGQYNRMIATLEGHIIGDPAFRFAAVDDNLLHREMVTMRLDGGKKDEKNALYWRELLDAPNADVQSLALRMLADGGRLSAKELLEKYRSCNYSTTRMECLKLLSRFGGACPEFVEAIGEGLYDAYELVRRNAARYAWMVGDESLIEKCADLMINRNEGQRVAFTINSVMQIMPPKSVEQAVEKTIAASLYPEQSYFDKIRKKVARSQRLRNSDLDDTFNKEAEVAKRIGDIRGIRNSTYHDHIPQLVALVADESEPMQVRVATAEALGWFTLSYRKQEIIDGLKAISTKDETLSKEICQTLNRLK